MELNIVDRNGKDTGKKVTLSDSIYAIEPNEHVLWLDVKQYLANQRQGTHKTKERSELSGSTRKLFKQKGTGGARRGDIKSNLLVGGATAHGPQPRDYGFKVNKKVKALARKSALSSKAKENQILIVEDFTFDAPKTKDFVKLTNDLQVADKKVLLVLSEPNNNVSLSARNLPGVKVVNAMELTTYDVLKCNSLVMAESSVAVIDKLLNA